MKALILVTVLSAMLIGAFIPFMDFILYPTRSWFTVIMIISILFVTLRILYYMNKEILEHEFLKELHNKQNLEVHRLHENAKLLQKELETLEMGFDVLNESMRTDLLSLQEESKSIESKLNLLTSKIKKP
jgi:peptidoglycan hydrolase CwlO-like protein